MMLSRFPDLLFNSASRETGFCAQRLSEVWAVVSLESAKTPFADQIYAEQTTEIIKLFCSVETMPIPQEWLVADPVQINRSLTNYETRKFRTNSLPSGKLSGNCIFQFAHGSLEVSLYSLERSTDHEREAIQANPNQQGTRSTLSGNSEGQDSK
jgi:hypothetical protein